MAHLSPTFESQVGLFIGVFGAVTVALRPFVGRATLDGRHCPVKKSPKLPIIKVNEPLSMPLNCKAHPQMQITQLPAFNDNMKHYICIFSQLTQRRLPNAAHLVSVIDHPRLTLMLAVLLLLFPSYAFAADPQGEIDTITRHQENRVEVVTIGNLIANTISQPEDLATFWTNDIHELNVLIPVDAGKAEIASALRIVAHCARRNADRDIVVSILPLPENEPLPLDTGQTNTRTVLLRRQPEAQLQLVKSPGKAATPVLSVMGPSDQLVTIADSLFPEESTGPEAIIPGNRLEQARRKTFAALGQSTPVLLSAEQPEFHISFSQADFGSPVVKARLSLTGTYHPKERNAAATLTVLLNGGLVQAVPLEQSGVFELDINFPSALLYRDNILSLRLASSSSPESKSINSFRITIEKASYLQAESGQGLPPGFERFPQALLPEFQVAFDEIRPDTLQGAAQLVALLQRLSPTPLRPIVVDWENAIASNRPLLAVVYNPAIASNLIPPVQATAFRLLGRDGQELLHLNPEASFALLQAYVNRNRDILLLTHTNYPKGLVHLPRHLAKFDGWYNLSGATWFQLSDNLPFAVPLQDKAVRLRPIQYEFLNLWSRIRPLVFGMMAVFLILCLLWMYPRVVRSQGGSH